jgi:peptidoglycan/LPS O-acetylase OafA/YrhL
MDEWGFTDVTSGSALAWLIWVAVAIPPVLLISAGSWYLIERPALSLRDRLTRIIESVTTRRRREPAS